MKKDTLLIAIEGIDGVGKNTQSTLLVEALKKQAGNCGFFSFPRYQTPTGKRVREYLDGKHDTLNLLSRAKLYSDDRLAAREEILDLLYQGVDVVCDRYVDSNAAFQTCIAELQSPGTGYSTRVRDYIFQLEYGSYMLPQADITIIMNVDVATSQRMMAERYQGNLDNRDKHERNIELMKLTHETYRAMAQQQPLRNGKRYLEIICNNPDGSLRTREDIHAEILQHVLDCKPVISQARTNY